MGRCDARRATQVGIATDDGSVQFPYRFLFVLNEQTLAFESVVEIAKAFVHVVRLAYTGHCWHVMASFNVGKRVQVRWLNGMQYVGKVTKVARILFLRFFVE